MKKKGEKESVAQRAICEYLRVGKDEGRYFFWRSNNVPVFAMNNGGRRTFRALPKDTPKGLPDIIVIMNGDFYALEVKREGAYMTDHQKTIAQKILTHGGFYHVVRSVEDVKILGF